MNHAIVRRTLIRTSALLLATAPVCFAYAAGASEAVGPTASPGILSQADSRELVGPAAPRPPVVEAASPELVREAASLRPGEFVWQPSLAEQGGVEIVVSIPLQRAYVYRGGTLIGIATVSTGRTGHETPVGTFNILEKRREHYSNLYNNAPMPFMQRLTWGGIALHAGEIPGRPASHGCIRLPLAFARQLFAVTRVGASVHILQASPSAGEALAMARINGPYTGIGGPDEDSQGVAN
jgi:L,D-transpeptidase catalytic domain